MQLRTGALLRPEEAGREWARIGWLGGPEVIRRRVRQSLADLPLRSRYSDSVNFSVKVLNFVQFGGPRGVWGRDPFQYRPVEDMFICPAGKEMRQLTRCNCTQRVGYRV